MEKFSWDLRVFRLLLAWREPWNHTRLEQKWHSLRKWKRCQQIFDIWLLRSDKRGGGFGEWYWKIFLHQRELSTVEYQEDLFHGHEKNCAFTWGPRLRRTWPCYCYLEIINNSVIKLVICRWTLLEKRVCDRDLETGSASCWLLPTWKLFENLMSHLLHWALHWG